MFQVPEQFRDLRTSDASYGNCGKFFVPVAYGLTLQIICSDGLGWEHVSVSVVEQRRCPTWEEMCLVKDLFWGEEDRVVQFHPPRSEYVTNHPYVLHLWRYTDGEFPHPPAHTVGTLGKESLHKTLKRGLRDIEKHERKKQKTRG